MKSLAKSTWTKWSFLGELGRSRPVQLSALFPTVGYLLLFSDALNDWLCGARGVICMPDEILPWKLVSVYFGLVALGAGALVFALRCPPVHSRYASAAEYIERERVLWLGINGGNTLNLLKLQLVGCENDVPIELAGIYRTALDGCSSVTSSNVEEIAYVKYQVRDWARPWPRLATAILFGVGFLLLAIPSLATFVEIAVRFVGKLF